MSPYSLTKIMRFLAPAGESMMEEAPLLPSGHPLPLGGGEARDEVGSQFSGIVGVRYSGRSFQDGSVGLRRVLARPGFMTVLGWIVALAGPAWSQTVHYRFDEGPNEALSIFSTTTADRPVLRSSGGNPGGYLSLTDTGGSTSTLVMLPNLSGSHPIRAFRLSVDVRVGNSTSWAPADGFSLSLAAHNDPVFTADDPGTAVAVPNNPEAGTTTGLVVIFKSFVYDRLPDTEMIEGLIVRLDNRTLLKHPMPVQHGMPTDPTSIQTGPLDPKRPGLPDGLSWQPLQIDMDTQGRLTVRWKGTVLVDALETGYQPRPGRWVIGARTGGANQNQHLDNLVIAQEGLPEGHPYLLSSSRSLNSIALRVHHHPETKFEAGAATLWMDNNPIDWDRVRLTQVSPSERELTYELPFPGYFTPDTARNARLVLKTPSGEAVSLNTGFPVGTPVVALPQTLRKETRGDLSSGFKVRAWQLPTLNTKRDMNQPWNLEWAESALQGLAGENLINAALAANEIEVVNLGPASGQGASGTFVGDILPGRLTGLPKGSSKNLNLELTGWIQFPREGFYRMAITSSDGCRLALGEVPSRQYLQVVAPRSIAGPVAAMSGGNGEPFSDRMGVGYGPSMPSPPLEAEAVFAEPRPGCSPFTNTAAIRGKIAIVERGDCYLSEKTRMAQHAGAVAVIIVNNTESYPGRLDTDVDDITIPTAQIPASVGRLLEQHQRGLRLSMGRDESFVLSELNSGGPAQRKEFAVMVPEPGSYPVRLVYYNVDGTGVLEWSSISDDGEAILVNDRKHEGALRVHRSP